MNYYEHHLGDYAKDAAHLSLVEDGAYRRLLDAYYTREQPLPGDVRQCCKLARANTKTERDAVKYVLGEFFDLRPDGYHQNRADVEIARFQAKSEKAKRSAEARWSNRETHSEGNANAYTDAMRTHSEGNAPRARPQSPVTSNQAKAKSKDQKPCPADAGRFADFWAAYPRHEAKKQAMEVWRRKRLDERAEALIADVERRKREHRPWLDGFVPHAVVYLRNERWDDAIDHAQRDARHDEPGYMAGAL